MAEPVSSGTARQELVGVIREVRKRWRTKLLLRGAVIVVGGSLLALALASWGLRMSRFSPASVTGLRVAVLAVLAILVALWFIRPMRRRVSDLQVALYVEEHEPSLQAAILSAVDAGATGAGVSATSGDVPPVIIDRMIDQAVEKARSIQGGRDVGRPAMQRYAVIFGTLVAVTALLLVVGPEFFRQGASALLVLSRSAEAASPYAIKVTPGDVSIPKGSDQTVSAELHARRSWVVLMVGRSPQRALWTIRSVSKSWCWSELLTTTGRSSSN